MRTLDREAERQHVDRLGLFLDCHITRDEFNDYIVKGKYGNIHADGAGYNAFIDLRSKKRKNNAIEALKAFGEVRQEADSEICYFFVLEGKTASFVGTLKRFLRFRQHKRLTDEQRAAMAAKFKERLHRKGVREMEFA